MKIFKILIIIISVSALVYFGRSFLLKNTATNDYSTYISKTSGLTMTYPNKLGDFELNVLEGVQDNISFKNQDDPAKNIFIILAKEAVNRGSVINGVPLSVFETTPYRNKQDIEFSIVSYQVDDKPNTYYLEAFNNPQEDKAETIYIKIVGSLTLDELRRAEENIKTILDGIEASN